jgi:N-formylglutamate deformylase
MSLSVPAFKFHRGTIPVLVSMPHAGLHIPAGIAEGMTEEALRLPDTDWHMETLYNFLGEMGTSVLVATHSRYVIDLNRPLDNISLYPGQDTTGLCPADTFHKEPLYQAGKLPDDEQIQQRCATYWQPYHAKIAEELHRMRNTYGIAMLWDAHSICSVLPRFFEGRLPDINLGTASGASCAPGLAERLVTVAKSAPKFSYALNGRFKGGYITRHYGQPENNIHAVQLELSQATYMQERFPYDFEDELASHIRPVLYQFLQIMTEWARAHS